MRKAPDELVRAARGRRLVEVLGGLDVVICCGSGGVGKTTVSAALAAALASTADRRVMVLTIDPARRLASALGMTGIGADPVTVSASRLRQAGLPLRGELVAAMLDQKSVWDRMVERYAPNRHVAERILDNRFYQGISDSFVGSHEYAALEALYELHEEGEYDCLIVDTPPSRSAIDFLEAPERISDFVGARLLSWLAHPSRVGFHAMNFAAAPLLHIADRLLGGEVLGELGDFVGESCIAVKTSSSRSPRPSTSPPSFGSWRCRSVASWSTGCSRASSPTRRRSGPRTCSPTTTAALRR